MSLPNEIVNIIEKGENLEKYGVNNWAITRKEALRLLELLEENKSAVYGGDVYVRNQNQIDLTYDNWFCERDKQEIETDYIKRSILFAKNYIDKYRSHVEGEKLFAMVFDWNLNV